MVIGSEDFLGAVKTVMASNTLNSRACQNGTDKAAMPSSHPQREDSNARRAAGFNERKRTRVNM
jgi:hypothetical protein